MAGDQFTELGWTHPWSPSIPNAPPKNLTEDMNVKAIPSGNAASHQAHYCHIQGLDLLVVHLFHYGLVHTGGL
jgi:hypothetical protein